MAPAQRIAVCAGSFDPLTNGHVDMIGRATRLFDRVTVAVLTNPAKRPWFTAKERITMIRTVMAEQPASDRIEVEAFDGLLADYVRRKGATAIIRGLRTSSEFADESQTATMNRHLYAGCETVFLVPAPEVAFISSRLVKEIAALGGSLEGLVPPVVARRLRKRRTPDRGMRA